jgi:predicted O-methyltransferase YrrM
MNKIFKACKALGLIIKNPWKLNLILDQNDEWKEYVLKKYGLSSLPVVSLNSFIHDSISIEPFAFLDGGSSPTDMALLKQLAAEIPKCKYFEIGTWRGESAANVASAADICYTLNLPDEDLFKLIDSGDFVKSHRFFSKNVENIRHLTGNSRTFNYSALNMKFDLIFIDGDHHFETILSDTANVIQNLCHENSIIVWHDYTYTPESIRYETLAAILDACPASLHPFMYYVKNTNCAILYRKEVSSYPGKKFALPEYYFSLQIKVNSI